MNQNPEVNRLMKMTKTCNGTIGIFACVPHLQASGANSGWHREKTAAMNELERNIVQHLPEILKQEKREIAAGWQPVAGH